MADQGLEMSLSALHGPVGGMDEVGRGCLAGPVCVGLVVSGHEESVPSGITDSKELSARQREIMAPLIRAWAAGSSIGWATSTEVDQWGLTAALRLAGLRAIARVQAQLGARGRPELGAIILDGRHNWLQSTEDTPLFSPAAPPQDRPVPPVFTRIKADLTCTAVAAASVIAKVSRDRFMEQLPDPGYDWARNKGYGSVRHREALRQMGPSQNHRLTWNLLGKDSGK